jgi:O-methyltransferase involved in polyketide biosynthesis
LVDSLERRLGITTPPSGQEVWNRGSATRGAWTTIVRTCLIDDLVSRSVDEGVDRVVDLAAGYDTRPYRLSLPASLTWVEIDSAAVLERKRELLEGERPRCAVERHGADLRDARARRRCRERWRGPLGRW